MTTPNLQLVLPDRNVQESQGFGSAYKLTPRDLLVQPLYSALKHALADRPAAAVLYLDRDSTYRVFVELAFTLARAGLEPQMILVASSQGIGAIPWYPSEQASLDRDATIRIMPDGYHVMVDGASRGPGCADIGRGPSVPLRDGSWNGQGLVDCMVLLTPAIMEASRRTGHARPQISVSADFAYPMQRVIDAMSAVTHSGLEVNGFAIHN